MMVKMPYISTPIGLKENRISVLVVEAPEVLREIVDSLLRQKNGDDGTVVFSENFKEIPVRSCVEIITDPFSLDLNQRGIINGTVKYIDGIAENELFCETNDLRSRIEQYAELVVQESELPFQIKSTETIGKLLKAVGIYYEEEDLSLPEKILQYLRLSTYLNGTKCFVLLNLKQFLSVSEIELFYRSVQLEKYTLLLLESSVKSHLSEENVLILDKDLCII